MTTLSTPSPRQQGPAERRFRDVVSAGIEQGLSKETATAQAIADDPDLHREMLAEANTNRRGAPRTHQRPQPPANRQPPAPVVAPSGRHPNRIVDAWNQAVQARAKSGVPTAQDIHDTVQAEPELHQAYLRASGSTVESDDLEDDAGSEPAAPSPQTSAIDEFDTKVAAAMAGGKSRPQAIRQVVIADGDLHRRYLAEVNRR